MARILVCVPGVPHKSRGASSVLFYHYIEQLLRAGHEVSCLLFLENGATADADVGSLQAGLSQSGRFSARIVEVPHLLRFARYSGQGLPARVPSEARAHADEFDAALVLYFDLGCLAAARELGNGRRRVAWLGDLAFDAIWHHALYDAREDWRAIRRLPKLWLICRRWKAAYRRFLSGVDLVVVSSKSSEAAMRPLGPAVVRYLPYPWPVEKPFRSVALARSAAHKPRFLFCGTLSGLGSRSAIHYLLGALYTELLRLWGPRGFEILITGSRSLPDWAMASIRNKPELVFEGFVDDLYARMDRCHAAIVPIDVPVGNRSRIVTAMGYGLLVISHPNTALGNPSLVSGETCLLGETAADFARLMKQAFDDRDLCIRIEQAARRAYERAFEPKRAGTMLLDEIRAFA